MSDDKTSEVKPPPELPTPGWLRLLIRFTQLFGVIGIVGSLAALMASYNWLADLAAQLRVQYLLMLIPALVMWTRLRRHKMILAGGLAFAINLGFVFPYLVSSASTTSLSSNNLEARQNSLRVLMLNVLRTNRQLSETLNEALSHDADFVFLMEVSPDWKPILESARDQFPHQKHILREDYTGVAFLSKYPWGNIEIIDTNDANPPLEISFSESLRQSQPFRLIATHPLPPIGPSLTASRDNQLLALAKRCQANPPSLLVGDFNLAPWSPRFSEILKVGKLVDSSLGYGLAPTLTPLPTIFGGVKVDHVLVTADVDVSDYRVSPCANSDHCMVIVDFNISSATARPELAE